MGLYTYFVDNTNPRSLNSKMRRNRLEKLLHLLEDLPRPVTILDIGGSIRYWETHFFTKPGIEHSDFLITIVNIDESRIGNNTERPSSYRILRADARDLSGIGDREFDVAHSNSVIEHVGGLNDMQRMANELLRVSRRHFVQTPNFYFPIEPHFKALFFHWLPRSVRMRIVRAMKVGHLPRATDMQQAARIIDSAQLVTGSQLRAMFPRSEVCRERFLGLTKSFIASGNSY